ncbi:MAG: sulfurtransferase-like selenium metabolism protein YedF [Syntrophales bacterium]
MEKKTGRQLDLRGLACPQPVINTGKALEEITEGTITVLVDNPESRENVRRFALKQGCKVSITEDGGIFYLKLTKGDFGAGGKGSHYQKKQGKTPDVVICITSTRLGKGSKELGKILMSSFFNTLWDYKPKPSKLIFINAGVMLTTEGSEVLDALKLLEKEGVKILSCGTCLGYYGITDKLRVGKVTNMHEILDALFNAERVINI